MKTATANKPMEAVVEVAGPDTPAPVPAEPIVERISVSDANWLHDALGELQVANRAFEEAKARLQSAQAACGFVARRFKTAYGLADADRIDAPSGVILRANPEG